jgi:hypothetical protein
MGECGSVCRPICEEHKKIDDFASKTQRQHREIILQPYTQQKEKPSAKTELVTIVTSEENVRKAIIESFPSHSTE